jgi:hypothetical protein
MDKKEFLKEAIVFIVGIAGMILIGILTSIIV